MLTSPTHEVTQLLLAWNNGDEAALAQLVPLVETELRRLAQRYLSRERTGHSLQTADLVNEAYLRLIDWKNVEWQNRAHFFGVAAQLMRRILVDHARRRRYRKRGGETIRVSLTEAVNVTQERAVDVVALNDALEALAAFDERKSQIVELRFFGGLSEKEAAEVLKISPRTVRREWSMAQAWLYRELSRGESYGA
jgi:RNA polymerase sigma factor (TIGR02999 family)